MLIRFLLLFLLFLSSGAQGVTEKELKEASETANKHVLVYYYGSDWCRAGNTLYTNVIANEDFRQQVAERFIVVECDVQEVPDDANKQLLKDLGLFRHDPHNFPSIRLFDTAARSYAFFDGLSNTLSAAALNVRLTQALEKYAFSQTQWTQASRSQGAAMADLLAAGILELEPLTSIGHLNRKENFKYIFDELKKCDPEDQQGWQRRFFFNGNHHAGKVRGFAGEEQWTEGATYIDELLQDPRNDKLTTEQLQQLHLLRFMLYRKREGFEKPCLAALEKTYQLDPDSHWGAAALGWQCMRGAGPVTLTYGWNSSHLSQQNFVWDLHAGTQNNFPFAGRFELKMRHNQGADALTIKKVTLLSANSVLAVDDTAQVLDKESREIVFLLPLLKPQDQLHLQIEGTTSGSDHKGTFQVVPMLPERKPL